jgi:hypothetical protein
MRDDEAIISESRRARAVLRKRERRKDRRKEKEMLKYTACAGTVANFSI